MDKLNYIDKIVKSKLNDYSMPVKMKIKFTRQNEIIFTKNILNKLLIYTFLAVVLASMAYFGYSNRLVKTNNAIAAYSYEFKINSNRPVYIPEQDNIKQKNINQNRKKIVVIEINQTKIDTVKR